MNQTAKLLEKLVEIESLPRQEKELAALLKAELKYCGLEVQEDEAAEKLSGSSGNLLAWKADESREMRGLKRTSAGERGSGLLLVAHMDRQFPTAAGRIITSQGYLESRGDSVPGADNLAGISVILGWLRSSRSKIPKDWGIALTVAEEIGLLGARCLPEEFLSRFSRALILDGEAPVGTIYTSEPPVSVFSLLPSEKMTEAEQKQLLQGLMSLISSKTSAVKTIYLDNPLPAAGITASGLLAAVKGHRQMAVNTWNNILQEVLRERNLKAADISSRLLFSYSGTNFNGQESWLSPLKQALAENSLELKFLQSPGISEASVLTGRGLPAVNLGIGVESAHTCRERVKLTELHKMIRVLEDLSNLSGG